MLVNVIALVIATAAAIPYNPPGRMSCGHYTQSWFKQNLPITSTDKQSEIVHSAAVVYDEDAVGWLFQTRAGKLWYEDGPAGNNPQHKPAPEWLSTAVLKFFGITRYSEKNLQLGTLYPTSGSSLALGSLANLNIQIKGCY